MGWQNWGGIGLHFLQVGKTSFNSTVQLPASSLASVEGTLSFKNLGQIDRQTERQTDSGVCRVAPQLINKQKLYA